MESSRPPRERQRFDSGSPARSLGKPVRLSAIRRFAKQLAERFQPERIILFGSYAYGKPHGFSDVDILVVMPARNEIDKAVHILNVLDPPFSVDLIVRTPHNLSWRVEEGDWFLREVLSKGKVLYAKVGGSVGAQSRSRPRDGKTAGKRRAAVS
jgi:predicted nucleotidyltransferase